ncbi:energy-coupling factor transporter transmembrane component T [Solicola gregarius]|uniref:Energy-coupling factor transporter transmembrane protein EcfT n=1 Tax=Solicola gregarius TaxID=2908642 RepID=A0AA46YLL2_9ACTN|nr:energy-coupling factor transporter transmembrane component T [Solicola gregarius]UYM07065.1 energy-coupling factor transporter transmembrane protein EcfT [Solicola gregarius]
MRVGPSSNPLVLIGIGLLALPASYAVQSLPIAACALGAYAIAGLLLVPRWRGIRLRIAVVVFAGLSVVYSTWLLGGHDVEQAVVAGLRILVLALPGAVLAAYVDPARFADQLGQRLRLPARPVVALSAALQRFERLGETWSQLDRARRARGFGPTRGPVSRARHAAGLTFGLLVSAMRDATSLSVAMESRGFGSATTRTWAEPAPWHRSDTALLVMGIALAAVPIALYVAGW